LRRPSRLAFENYGGGYELAEVLHVRLPAEREPGLRPHREGRRISVRSAIKLATGLRFGRRGPSRQVRQLRRACNALRCWLQLGVASGRYRPDPSGRRAHFRVHDARPLRLLVRMRHAGGRKAHQSVQLRLYAFRCSLTPTGKACADPQGSLDGAASKLPSLRRASSAGSAHRISMSPSATSPTPPHKPSKATASFDTSSEAFPSDTWPL
jgi:hypothetical protein